MLPRLPEQHGETSFNAALLDILPFGRFRSPGCQVNQKHRQGDAVPTVHLKRDRATDPDEYRLHPVRETATGSALHGVPGISGYANQVFPWSSASPDVQPLANTGRIIWFP